MYRDLLTGPIERDVNTRECDGKELNDGDVCSLGLVHERAHSSPAHTHIHSLASSLAVSLSHSVTQSLTYSATHSVTLSVTHSVTPSVNHSVTR